MEPRVDLIIAADAHTRDEVYRFRALVADEWGETVDVLPRPYATSAAVGLQDLLDPFAILAAAVDRASGAILGAVRTNFLREGAIPLYPELYGLRALPAEMWQQSSVTSCWTMAPPFGCATAGALDHPALLLAWTLYEIALRERICHDYLDCKDRDLPFFSKLGYRYVREITHPVRGRSHLLRLDVYDWIHLAEIKSPFLSLARSAS